MTRRTCPGCHASIVTGTDDHGIDTTADPAPLSALGEALAVLGGRDTWEHTAGGRRLARELWRRTPAHIGGPAPGGGDVLATHRCGQPIPAAWTVPVPVPALATAVDPEEAPF